MNTQYFFHSLCQVNGLNPNQAKKIINARYKPYLSAIDDQYYSGNDGWDARTNALNAAIRRNGIEEVKRKIEKL